MTEKEAKCQLCGEPMPLGEEMFFYHGYSGPCQKPPLTRDATKETLDIRPRTLEKRQIEEIEQLTQLLRESYVRQDELNREKLTIWKVIQRGKFDEQLSIVETNTTPQGVVVIVE